MDVTENRRYPFPQCDPPLIKDASDIIQIENLAQAVNDDVAGLYELASRELIHPDCVRMSCPTIGNDTTSNIETVFYTAFSFDNTPGQQMADTVEGVIRIVETGLYMVGGYAQADIATTTFTPRAGILVNGFLRGNYQGPFRRSTATSWFLEYQDSIFLDAGDTVTTTFKHSLAASTAYTYSSRIWALQIAVTG